MKKITLSLIVAISMFSCNSVKNMNRSDVINAATVLGSMSSNSTIQQVNALFSLLDTNNDVAISSSEAIGSVAENFTTLDTNDNASLNLTEFKGLLDLLK